MALTGTGCPFVPFENRGAAIHCVLHECARHVTSFATHRWTVKCFPLGRIDPANRDLIEFELLGCFRDDRIDDPVSLHRTRRALLRPWRRIRDDRHAAKAHREWLPDQRRGVCARSMIAHWSVWPVVFDDEEVEGGDASVLAETDFRPTDHAGA